MFIAIDLIIVAVMAAVIINAAKRGFVSTVFGLAAVIISLIIAIMFYKELGIYINEKFVFDAIEPRVVEFAKEFVAEKGEQAVESLQNVLPSDVLSLVNLLGIDMTELSAGLGEVPQELASAIAAELSISLSNIAAFAALFLASFVVLSLVCLILNLIAKLPVIKGINTFLGVVFGIVEALVLGVVIAKVAVALCGIFGSISGDVALTSAVEETVIAKLLLSISPW